MNCANHPDRERIAFCQNCGKPLCQECTRTVGSAVFCEPCLAAKLAGASGPAGAPSYSYVEPPAYGSGPVIPPPPAGNEPSPVLALILGFLPGVGAMYNGQYAKGVVHLIVFAVLVSLANQNGIFGLFIAGWIVYQAIEANHTARARLAGTPLPNPFGLNDLGERLGFGKSWPSTSAPSARYDATPGNPAPDAATVNDQPPPSANYPPYTPPASHWGAPAENYAYPPPPVSGYTATPFNDDLAAYSSRSRFPTGAVWLIVLGVIFLVGNVGIFHGFPVFRLVPFLLIALGVWLFVHKMTDSGAPLASDGTPAYHLRLLCALRSSIWIVVTGILFFLDTFHILSWARSWPLFLITGGLLAIYHRTIYSNAAMTGYPYAAPPVQPAPPPVAASTVSVVPVSTHEGNAQDQERS